MAHVGMKYPVAAELKEDGTYEAGFVVGKAINFTGTPNKNDVKLYADDDIAETDQSIMDEGVSLGVDNISLKVQADLLGHTYTAAVTTEGEEAPEKIVVSADDVAPFFGVGFYKRRKKNNVVTYTAIWLHKVQFSTPTENAETKAGTTNFQTPTIEGTAYPLNKTVGNVTKAVVHEKAEFTTETEARAWLNTMAGIVAAA